MEDYKFLGSSILNEAFENKEDTSAEGQAIKEYEALRASETTSNESVEEQNRTLRRSLGMTDDNATYYSSFADAAMKAQRVNEGYRKRYNALMRHEADFTDEGDANAFVRMAGQKYGVDDPEGKWITDHISAVDAVGEIKSGVKDVVRREYTPMERAELVRNAVNVIETFATQGADGLEAQFNSMAGKPLGMNWMAYKKMRHEDPAALVRAIRDSGFYDGKDKMANVLGKDYEYETGRENLNAAYGTDPNIAMPMGLSGDLITASKDARTYSKEEMAAAGKQRALAMITAYENDTANARNAFGAAINAIKIKGDPRLGEWWKAFSGVRQRKRSVSEAGYENQQGDVNALVAEISKDFAACKTDEDRAVVKRRFDDICAMVAQDDNRNGYAHHGDMMSRATAWGANWGSNVYITFEGLGKKAYQVVTPWNWGELFDRMPKGTDQQARDAQFEWMARKSLTAAANQGLYSEGTWVGGVADEIANLAVMSGLMKVFTVANTARTVGHVMNLPARAYKAVSGRASIVGKLAKPGNAVIRFGNKMDPAVSAAYKKEVEDGLAASRAEIENIGRSFYQPGITEEQSAKLAASLAKAEQSVASAEVYLTRTLGKDIIDWGRMVVNELPSVLVMETAGINEKQCAHAYEIGKKMGETFRPELLETAATYELAGATAETAVFMHIPKIFMDGVRGLTKSAKFNTAARNVYTRFERMMEAGDVHGARCLWDSLGMWQVKTALNAAKGGMVMGTVSAIGDVSDNYLRGELRNMGVGTEATVPTADGKPYILDEQKPVFNAEAENVADALDATKSIFGNYITTAARAATAMHVSGTVAGLAPDKDGNVITHARAYRENYLNFRMLKDVEHAEVAALARRLRRAKDGSNVVMIDGKPTVIDFERNVYENLPDDPVKAQQVVRGYLEANREAYDDIHRTINGYCKSIAQAVAEGKRSIPQELRDTMRQEIGEKATGFIEDLFNNIARDANPFKGTAATYLANDKLAEHMGYWFGERKRIGEYDAKELSKITEKALGVKVKMYSVDEDGAVHLHINPEGEMKEGGSTLLRNAEIVIKNDKIEVLTGGKYDAGWAHEVIDNIMTGKNGFSGKDGEPNPYESFKERLSKLTKEERDAIAERGDPDGILGEIQKTMVSLGGTEHGVHQLVGRKSVITMNIDEEGGQTRYEVAHELAHGMLEQLRQRGIIGEKDNAFLAERYGGGEAWEENFVDDVLEKLKKTTDDFIGEALAEIDRRYGDTKIVQGFKEVIGDTVQKIGSAAKKLHDSILREEANKSAFEMFAENRVSEAKKAFQESKTSEERRKDAAEHVKKFDEQLGEKIANGERIAAEEVAANGEGRSEEEQVTAPTDADGGDVADTAEETKKPIAIEDKSAALEAAGYVKTKDGSWICEKTNPVEWHKACAENARAKLEAGEELNRQEREHIALAVDETGSVVDVLPSDTAIEDGKPVVFDDGKGNRYVRYDVNVAPFPADANSKFMSAASKLLNRHFMTSGQSGYTYTSRTDKNALAKKVMADIKNRKPFMDIFDLSKGIPHVRVGDAVIELSPNGSTNGGAVHANDHIIDLGLTYDPYMKGPKSPVTAQEINDYLEWCLKNISPVAQAKPNRYERKLDIGKGVKLIVITAKLDPDRSAALGGAKETVITIMSNRRKWQIDKLIADMGLEAKQKASAVGLKSAPIPEGRADKPLTGNSIPNYLKGFKGAPNKKENNAIIDEMLRAQQERGRYRAWPPDDLRIDMTEVPISRPVAPDTRRIKAYSVSGTSERGKQIADRINEEAKKIGAVTRVEDAVTGKPAILLGYHGTQKGGFTKFNPYTTNGSIIPAEKRLDWSNPDARWNVTGMRGVERIVGPKEYKKLVKEIQKVYDTTYAHLVDEHKNAHNYRGGMKAPRMWEVEKKMQDGSVKLSLKIGGKTLRVHFTGAATDKKPRLEYAGQAADIDGKTIKDIKQGVRIVRVSDIIDDPVLKDAYPDIWNAALVVAEKGDYGTTTAKVAAKVTGDVGTKSGERTMSVRDMPVRQVVATDRGATRSLTCAAMPAQYSKAGNKKTDGMIVVYEDSLDAKNVKRLNKDLGQAIVDLIAAEEGWKDPSRFAIKDWKKVGKSRRNSDGTYNEIKGERSEYNTENEGNSIGKVDGLNYRTFALFGDPKLSLVNNDSILSKVIDKYVAQYKGGSSGEADAVTAAKVREIIVETLADAYQQFASVKESKAWASRMGKDWRELERPSEELLEIDKDGLVETKQGLQSTRASEKVIKFYDEKVAENVDKALKKFFKANDKTFRQMFKDARQDFLVQREAEAAAREFNPTKVRSEAAYRAYLSYCKENGIKPRDEDDVKAWLAYRQQTGEAGKVGRKAVGDKRKVSGSRMKSLNATIGGKEGDVGEVVNNIGSSQQTGHMYQDLDAAYVEMKHKAEEKAAKENGDLWDKERDIAIREIAEMLTGGKVTPNRRMGEMMKIVRKHSTVTDADVLSMHVAEISNDVANEVKAIVTGGKRKFSVSGRRNTKSVEDYLVEATAAKMVRGRIYGFRSKNEQAIGKWIEAEAAKVGVNEADVQSFAVRVKGAAEQIASRCMDEVKANARVGEIKRIIGEMGYVNGIGRDIASAFAHGDDHGVAGQYATQMAEKLADRIVRRQERSARGLTLAELNSKIGMDIVRELEALGTDGARFATGDDFATAFVRNFTDVMRLKKAEYRTMNDSEFENDSRARQDLAMTVKSWIREVAKRLTYGDMRRDAEVEAARIAADSSAAPTFGYLQKTVQNFADRVSEYIRRNGTNETNELLQQIEKYIDKTTGATKKAKQGELVDRRRHDPNQQNYWNFAKKAMRMSGEKVAERVDELRSELELSFSEMARLAGDKASEVDADGVLQRRHDKMLELNALLKYGGLKEKTYGEIRDTFDNVIADDIAGAAVAFTDRIEAQTREYKRVIGAFTKELGAFRDRKGRQYNELKKNKAGTSFLINSIADLFKRLEAHLHEGSEAYKEIEDFRRAMSLGHIRQGKFTMDWEKELRMVVKTIYGEDFEKVVERLSLKDAKYDQFSRTAWEYDKSTGIARQSGAGSEFLPTHLSKANLIYIYLARRQADMQENNRIYGCDGTYMDDLLNCLDARDIRLAEWITSAYERMREQISPVSERITGLKVLSPVEDYCPLDFLQRHVSGDSRKYSANPFPTFLTRRTGHDAARLDEAQDVIRVFENHVQDSGHYMGFGEITQRVCMTLKDARVQNAYAQLIGTKAKNDVYAQLTESLTGERRDASMALNGVRNFITATSLFYNVGSAVKQLEGCGGWAVETGIMPWLKGLVVNSATSAEVRQGMRELADSGIFAVRGEEGISEAMVALANSADGIKRGVVAKTYNWYKRHGMDLTKYVDRFASRFMAAQYYTMRKKFYMNGSGGGYDEATAREMAIADTDYAIQVTQQSGRPEFLHYAQRRTTGKLLTQFSGPAFVRWGVEVEALHRAFVMGDPGAKRKLLSKMVAMHVICGPLLAMAGGLASMILGDDDKKNKELWHKTYRDCAVNLVDGPLTGWFIIGQLLNAGTYEAYDMAIGSTRSGPRKHFEAPVLSKLGSLQVKSLKAFKDVIRYVNWGKFNKRMIKDIWKDTDDLLRLIVPAYRNVNAIDNIKRIVK